MTRGLHARMTPAARIPGLAARRFCRPGPA